MCLTDKPLSTLISDTAAFHTPSAGNGQLRVAILVLAWSIGPLYRPSLDTPFRGGSRFYGSIIHVFCGELLETCLDSPDCLC